MSDNEIGLFVSGIGLGMLIVNGMWHYSDWRKRRSKRRTAPETPGAISGPKDG